MRGPRFLRDEYGMPSPFETTSTSASIPIIFATKSTWEAIRADLPEAAREFAAANGFSAKPGSCLTLPAADGRGMAPAPRHARALVGS